MSFSTLYLPWILLSAVWLAEIDMHLTHRRSEDFFAAGLVFRLQCNRYRQNVSVFWSRVSGPRLENLSGVSIRDDDLWFLPVQLNHSGQYSCFSRKGNETWETIFDVFVHNETCPRRNREDDVKSTNVLRCLLSHIFELDPSAQVTWRNNCQPLSGNYGTVFPINRSPERVGLYSCFVNFTFEGENFSAAQTTEIYNQVIVVTRPEIIYPRQDTHAVTLGESTEVSCKALVGENDMDETDIYWISDIDDLDLNYESTTLEESGRKYMLSVLSIPEVTAEYLYVNLTCLVQHPAGTVSGTVQLIPESPKHYRLGLGLAAVLALLMVLATVALIFRVDLVLAFRDVCPSAAACNDGKSYDAYVSYLHGDQLSSSTAMTFALRFLPAELEDLYGYKLFISGRDELPGEAVHEVVADRMSRSRRLIIVLTAQSQSDVSQKALLSEAGMQMQESCSVYEQRVGLYDALVKQGLKVILVQVEDGVEEAQLPESLRFIWRTRGILRWRTNAGDRANRRFWKRMRYLMPPRQRH
ncbi:interleukin-1 receptor type 1 [Pseudorasbora parva]|uniref:interleukin-1 receptor type 1 n=1 Tax=Pseudorasbora parva TaxID=51549 RepID=UPI00351E59F0